MMKIITDTWFECKVKHDKMMDDGSTKSVHDTFVVNAFSFTEAEAKALKEASVYFTGAQEVSDIKKAKYAEIFFDDRDTADKWYKAKVAFIFTDEKTGKDKKSNVLYLVQAPSFADAVKNVTDVMSKSLGEYRLDTINETNIFSVCFGSTNNVENDKPEYEQ